MISNIAIWSFVFTFRKVSSSSPSWMFITKIKQIMKMASRSASFITFTLAKTKMTIDKWPFEDVSPINNVWFRSVVSSSILIFHHLRHIPLCLLLRYDYIQYANEERESWRWNSWIIGWANGISIACWPKMRDMMFLELLEFTWIKQLPWEHGHDESLEAFLFWNYNVQVLCQFSLGYVEFKLQMWRPIWLTSSSHVPIAACIFRVFFLLQVAMLNPTPFLLVKPSTSPEWMEPTNQNSLRKRFEINRCWHLTGLVLRNLGGWIVLTVIEPLRMGKNGKVMPEEHGFWKCY